MFRNERGYSSKILRIKLDESDELARDRLQKEGWIFPSDVEVRDDADGKYFTIKVGDKDVSRIDGTGPSESDTPTTGEDGSDNGPY